MRAEIGSFGHLLFGLVELVAGFVEETKQGVDQAFVGSDAESACGVGFGFIELSDKHGDARKAQESVFVGGVGVEDLEVELGSFGDLVVVEVLIGAANEQIEVDALFGGGLEEESACAFGVACLESFVGLLLESRRIGHPMLLCVVIGIRAQRLSVRERLVLGDGYAHPSGGMRWFVCGLWTGLVWTRKSGQCCVL